MALSDVWAGAIAIFWHIDGHRLTFVQDDFPSAKVDAEAKRRFLTRLMSCRTLRRARECMEEFALKARGLENTAYGLGSSSL